ncbi:MAG TPA: hypothetical protein PK158_04970 [Spirochaetota bacterium]|nr:hypothetical protein [Spirochaetota bacterium]
MKKTALPLIFLVLLFCSGCFDIIQYFEVDKGVFSSKMRVSFSKEFAKNETSLPQKDSFQNNPKLKELGFKIKTSTVNTQFDQHMIIDISAPESAITKRIEDMPFGLIPYKDKAGQYLFIFKNDKEGGNTESDKMANMMMASVKYRMMFGKKMVPAVCKIFTAENTNGADVSIEKFGDMSYVDFPFMSVFTGDVVLLFSTSKKTDISEARDIIVANIAKRKALKEKKEEEQPEESAEVEAETEQDAENLQKGDIEAQ